MINLRTLVLLTVLGVSASAFAAPPVNINTADASALAEAISGVGLKRAEAIVAYREQHGAFKSVDELMEIRGIGERIVEKSRANLKIK